MTPQTEREWQKALVAAHPDTGGNADAFIALHAARAAWRKAQPRVCARPGCSRMVPVSPSGYQPKHCSKSCSNAATGLRLRKQRKLKGETG